MEKLISKVQYKNYETGEFSNIESRIAEETIQLINNFPWEEQRHLTDVMLTCPSVTIERGDGFLKLGTYFNGKFCLYLYENGHVYKKVITRLSEGDETINNYHYGKDISGDFERERMLYQPKQHFLTNSFEYTVTNSTVFSFLFFPVIILAFGISIVLVPLVKNQSGAHFFANLILGILFSIVFCGFNLYLFFNYYFYSKDLYLQISGGQNTFYFGPKNEYREYAKDEILTITKFKNLRHRRGRSIYAVYVIDFKNGEQIRFPSLLINDSLFLRKFVNYQISEKHKLIPTI